MLLLVFLFLFFLIRWQWWWRQRQVKNFLPSSCTTNKCICYMNIDQDAAFFNLLWLSTKKSYICFHRFLKLNGPQYLCPLLICWMLFSTLLCSIEIGLHLICSFITTLHWNCWSSEILELPFVFSEGIRIQNLQASQIIMGIDFRWGGDPNIIVDVDSLSTSLPCFWGHLLPKRLRLPGN